VSGGDGDALEDASHSEAPMAASAAEAADAVRRRLRDDAFPLPLPLGVAAESDVDVADAAAAPAAVAGFVGDGFTGLGVDGVGDEGSTGFHPNSFAASRSRFLSARIHCVRSPVLRDATCAPNT